MKYFEIINEIKKGKIENSYLLVGENEFLKDEFIKLIKNVIINKEFEKTDFITLYGDEPFRDNVIPWLYSSPFGSTKKLLIIKRVEKLSPENKEIIQKYINTPASTSVLILTMSEEDKKRKMKHGEDNQNFYNITEVECKNLSEKGIENWIKSYVKEKGFNIEDGAINLLFEIIGTDQIALSTELDKIINYTTDGEVITTSVIEKIFTKKIATPKYIVYFLTHSIAHKNLSEAYKKLHLILEFDDSPKSISNILWKIYEHFSELLKIKMNPYYLPNRYGCYAYEYKKEAKLWSEENILNAFCFLFETDFSIKTGRVDKEFAIEELIYKLCC